MNTEEGTFTSGSLLEWYKALAIQRADQLKQRDETIKQKDEDFAEMELSYALRTTARDETIRQLKEALRGVVSIAGYYHNPSVKYTDMPYKNWNDSINKAWKLLTE